jgi:pimeloyl-ACP methyl ester carboxylesterase
MERTVDVNGQPCRIWEKGEGETLFWLASSPMMLRWSAFHDAIAAHCRLVVCGLPGFPGSKGHDVIDDHLSWCLAARDLLSGAGFKAGDRLMGSSTAGALAADVAAIWPKWVGSLVLIAPFGLYDEAEPSRDMFALHPRDAVSKLSADPKRYAAQVAAPDGIEPVLWNIDVVRGNEAAARFLWPLGDTRLKKRLARITCPIELIWGESDVIQPPSYADRIASAVSGDTSVTRIPGAGHLVEIDQPQAAADAVLGFLTRKLVKERAA